MEKAKAGTLPAYEVMGARKQLALIQYGWPTMNAVDRQELRDNMLVDLYERDPLEHK